MSIEVSRSQRSYKPQADHQAKSKMSAANDELAISKTAQLSVAAQDGNKSLFSFPTLVLVLLIHAVAIFGLLWLNPADTEVKVPEATPMMVSLVSEPAPEPEPEVAEIIPKPEPKPVIKKPKPVPKKIVEPTPIPEEIPEPVEMAPAAAEAEPAIVSEPAPPPAHVIAKQEPKPEPVVEEVVEPPKFGAAYLHNPPPAYPALSRRVGEEGRVMLRVLVSKNGDAQQVEIESGSGSSRLDKAALEAVKKWRFIPAKRNNQPVSAYVIVPIQFTLNS